MVGAGKVGVELGGVFVSPSGLSDSHIAYCEDPALQACIFFGYARIVCAMIARYSGAIV